MIKNLTEKELIDIVSENEYKRFAFETYQTMRNSDSYKQNKDEITYYLGVSKISEKLNLHFEATLTKKRINNLIVADDFGFINLVITDEIDYSLDRFNLAKKTLNNPVINSNNR